MSFPIVRQGDTNSAGGRALIPRDQVKSSNKPLAAFSSKISPHPCCGRPGCTIHCAASITGGSSTVKAQGKPVHKVVMEIHAVIQCLVVIIKFWF